MQPDTQDLTDHHAEIRARHVRMANQIATYFSSKPHEQGVAGVAAHINDFWEPRMRSLFFDIVDSGGAGLHPLVLEAAASVRRPSR
jgi:hypothetical protein